MAAIRRHVQELPERQRHGGPYAQVSGHGLSSNRRSIAPERVSDEIAIIPRVPDFAGQAEGLYLGAVMNCTMFANNCWKCGGRRPASPEVQLHCSVCDPCALELEADQKDNGAAGRVAGAGSPSPYFDVKLQARLREEAGKSLPWDGSAGFANRPL